MMLHKTNILVCIYTTNDGEIDTRRKIKTPSPGPIGVFTKDADDQEDEVTYADADYKDVYEFGPVSYKNASEEAAARKKAELATRFNNPKYNYYTPPPKSNKQD